MSEFNSEEIKYRWGITFQRWEAYTIGITFNFAKFGKFRIPNVVIDIGKFAFTFGWCVISSNVVIVV